jgi:uncharacterized DUF497 family protein
MRYEWDEAKRASNLKEHGFDFADASKVFAGLTATYEDDRFRYGEQRFVTLGFLNSAAVSIVHTESADAIRILSFRQATQHETEFLFQKVASELPSVSRQARPGRDKADRRAPRAGHKARSTGRRKKRPKTRPS